MLETRLKYDFPKNNPDPFDENFNGNFFVSAQGFSNLSDNLEDLSTEECQKHIPMGYKTLLVCYRIVLIKNGNICKSWDIPSSFDSLRKTSKTLFLIDANKQVSHFVPDWKRNIQTTSILKPSSTDGSLDSHLWNDLTECIHIGKETSKNLHVDILVSLLIENIYWH